MSESHLGEVLAWTKSEVRFVLVDRVPDQWQRFFASSHRTQILNLIAKGPGQEDSIRGDVPEFLCQGSVDRTRFCQQCRGLVFVAGHDEVAQATSALCQGIAWYRGIVG